MTTPDERRRNHADGLFGVYVGIVSDIEDPEDISRVKVTFPWRDEDDESRWARVASGMAGDGMGTYFLPEKGDEVLVAFGNGNFHDPYVVGSLWNGKQAPPRENDVDNPIREIHSRADHTLTFDDTDDEGAVTIETGKGQRIVVDDQAGEITVEDENGNRILLDDQGIELSSDGRIRLDGKSVEVEADQDVSIDATTVEASADSSASISSSGSLSLESNAKTSIEANGMLQAKTSGVLKLNGSMIMLN